MGLDPLSPVAPARVRCLIVPCGRITRSRFLEFVKRLQEEAVVRLGDVSPSPKPERNSFSPLAFPQGVVVLDFVVSESTPGQKALFPFEISREPLLVLGLADAAEYELRTYPDREQDVVRDVEEERRRQGEALLEISSSAEALAAVGSVALVHRVFIFDFDQPLPKGEGLLTPVPSLSKSSAASMKTIMCDTVSLLLAEMASYARTIQTLPTIETPKQTMPDGYVAPPDPEDSKRQSWFPGARSSSPSLALQRLGQRASLPAHLFQSGASNSVDEHTRSEASTPTSETAATTFEQMQISTERRGMQLDSSSQERSSVQSLASDPISERARNQGRGRVGIVIGQMHLVAGRWPDAMRELVQGGIIARSTNDHIWHAKAVESILTTLILCAWAGVEFEIPPLCLPIAERSSVLLGKSSKKNEMINLNETFISQTASKEASAENLQNLSNVLPEIVQHIIRLYTRSTAEHVSQLALSEIFIRLSKLSAFLLRYPKFGGTGVLDAIVLNRSVRISDRQGASTPSSAAKAEIASLAAASIPPQGVQDTVSYVDRLTIHAGAATVLGMLGYHRKKAFVLRELLGFLLPALQHGSERKAAGHALYSSPFFGSPRVTNGVSDGSASVDVEADSDTVYDFLALICQTYGAIVMDGADGLEAKMTTGYAGDKDDDRDTGRDEGAMLAARIETEALTRAFGSKRLKTDILFMCMNVCEVVSDLRGVVSFASSLLRTVGSGIAPGPRDVDGGPSLPPEEQMRASGAITHASATATSGGAGGVGAEYWDDFIVRDVEILPITPDLNLTPRKRSELATVKANMAYQNQGPFIVNQFTSRISASKREQTLATGEKFSFAILLQNLYDVNLEIDSLEIDAEGPSLDARLEGIVIGPYKTQRLRLVAQPLVGGQLVIRGCKIKVRNCNVRSYPIFRESWRPAEPFKLKRQGLSSVRDPRERPSSAASEQFRSSAVGKPPFSSMSVKVVDPQPRLILKSTSVPQGNVLVLEGERKKIEVALQNVSDNTVDFISLSFDDSTLPILQAAVQDRELPAADLYEIEYGIYKKAALSWKQPDGSVKIGPGEVLTVEVEVLGKPGLNSGAIHVDYAATRGPENDTDVFYTRRLPIQLAISVGPSVDLIRNDILALAGPLGYYQHLATDGDHDSDSLSTSVHSNREWTSRLMKPLRERLLISSDAKEYCLLQFDFYNSWTQPLMILPEVRKDVSHEDEDPEEWTRVFTVTEILDPGQSTRFLIPVPRMALADPYAPIPSLNPTSRRQFVVSAGKISESYERSSRDAFWHREEILKYVRVKWRTVATGIRTTGLVELRAIRLTMRMLDALKLEGLNLTVGLVNDEHVRRVGASYFKASADEFMTIRTRIVNRSAQPIHPILRLQPSLRNQAYNVALDLSKKFAFTGLLQQPLEPIEAGGSVDVELGCVFLCAGEFEIGASVEEMKVSSGGKKTGRGQRDRAASVADLDVLSSERTERRIWFAKEVCKVDIEEP